jgi:hypothetical protein
VTSKEKCVELYSLSIQEFGCGANERASIEAGRATFAAERLQRCFDGLAQTYACSWSMGFEDCQFLVDGTVPVGQPCYQDFECVSSAFCSKFGGACPGTCVARVAAGGDAGLSDRCVAGYEPQNGKCVPYAKLGESCAPIPPSALRRTCEGDAYCSASSICAEVPKVGEACDSYSSCQLGAKCVNDICEAARSAGESCANETYPPDCKADLTCIESVPGQAGVCSPPRIEGEQCVGSSCYPTLYCKGYVESADGGITAGTCAVRAKSGEPCQGFDSCENGLYCSSFSAGGGTCQPQKKNGEACTQSAECEFSSACSNNVCASSACVAPTP